MEGDSTKKKTIKKIQRTIANASNVLSAFWIRLSIQIDNGGNWLILGSRCRFLWNIRFFLAFLYIIIKSFA